MRKFGRMLLGSALLMVAGFGNAAAQTASNGWMPDLTQKMDYTLHRATSKDQTGANYDARALTPGASLTVLDADGPGMISHVWFTINDGEPYHLKRIVLRMYWDNETTPSVEAPIGDFYGLGTGDYVMYQSEMLSVGAQKALNCFFPMPYAKHARITITNEGKFPIGNLYYNIEYRENHHPWPAHTMYFHAQYRQANPNKGWTGEFFANGDPLVVYKRNETGADNYVWFEAQGEGHYVGVTMSVLQNQDGWWGEGNDMFFIDGAPTPAIAGTGTEDYFLGAWDFGSPFAYQLYGAPVVGKEVAGGRSSVYRFHLDSPIPFTKSMKGTIEHGHANHRSDKFSSVAYWYQTEPHMAFPPFPPVDSRIPSLFPVGGPGNVGPDGKPTTPVR
jgi:hypothetical protein